MTDLGSLPHEASEPTAINERGQIVGLVHPPVLDPDHAILWEHEKLVDLGDFGAPVKQAIAINDRGQILVQTSHPDRAFLWQRGRVTDLGSLGGGVTYARALDDGGEVVGTSTTKTGVKLPFVWRRGRMLALPTLAGAGPWGGASAIDGRGHVLGYGYVAVRAASVEVGTHARAHAVLWTLRGG
jgi:probable HAF family extracellular repeat protein